MNYHIVASRFSLLIIILSITGCASYYTKTLQFNEQFAAGNIEAAKKTLEQSEKKVKNKDRLLYYFQQGVVYQMLGEYTLSNQAFEQAYVLIEDYQKKLASEALSLITNQAVKPYMAEDHEAVLVHYYMALNYIMLHQYDEALVECRRINNRLNVQYDKYEYKSYRYKADAFAHNLMGIVYEAKGDVNNAFIAYRNAYNTYKDIYSVYFNTPAPYQLKNDLLRTAYLNGFHDELMQYEKEFKTHFDPESLKGGDIVFFWHNGLGPVKDEWSINFTIVKGQGGQVFFVNEEFGLNFPFYLSGNNSNESNLSDLKFIRVAFPKYLSRKPVFNKAFLSIEGQQYNLEQAENIDKIAHTTLEDRMMREMGTALLRLALKQIAEEQLRQENANLGMLMSIANAITEKADTRNWQTLPYAIHYTRVTMPEGNYDVTLKTSENGQSYKAHTFHTQTRNNQTSFLLYHSLESYAPGEHQMNILSK